MRNIKFRAKKINTNQWVYGYYAQAGNNNELRGIIMPKGNSVNDFVEVDPKTVGQFICVNNNVEIFSGDILKSQHTFENSNEHQLCLIEWDEKQTSYVLKTLNGLVNPPLNWMKEYDLAGNNIDNPEMLIKNAEA